MRLFVYLLLVSINAAKETKMVSNDYCCITELGFYVLSDESKIRKRFDIYKSIGNNMLRIAISWSLVEPEEGKIDQKHIDQLTNYMKIAEEYSFKIKLIFGIMMAPPKWYLDKYPDAMLEDQNGLHPGNTLSYWYPDVKKVSKGKTALLMKLLKDKGVWDNIDGFDAHYRIEL